MARRKASVVVRSFEPAPPHIRQLLAGLVYFDGDLAAMDAARKAWCEEHGCHQQGSDGRTCEDLSGRRCSAGGRTGVVRVTNVRGLDDGPA